MSNKMLTYDILKEIFNISVGKAASILSEIMNKKIVLDVPNLEIINSKTDELRLENYSPKILNGTLMVSSISFQEELTGQANLIFPAEKMRNFINICLNTDEKEDLYDIDFTDIDFDVIKEIGNIILNCIIGEIGNYLNINLKYTLPEVKIFDKIDFNKDIFNEEYKYILMLYITFKIDNTRIEGGILIDLTIKSLKKLLAKIAVLEDELYE